MAIIVDDLVIIENRIITSVIADLLLPLSTHLHKRLLAVIRPAGEVAVVVDVSAMITRLPNLVITESYGDFLQARLINDLVIAQFTVPDLPQRDPITRCYPNRISVIDALAEQDWVSGYGNANTPNDVTDVTQVGVAPDVVLTPPPGTNLANLLVAVNGVFHSTQVIEQNLFVLDGYENIRQSGQQSLVACDTTMIGGHTVIPITPAMVVSPLSSTANGVILSMPTGVSLTGTAVLVVIDGYLQMFNTSYHVLGPSALSLDTYKIDLIGNFLNNPNMRYQTDLFGTKNHAHPFNPNVLIPVVPSQYPSDASDSYLDAFNQVRAIPSAILTDPSFLLSRITSVHSFIIVLNNPDLFIASFPLISYGDWRRYESHGMDTPRGLFLHGRGKVLPYTVTSAIDGQHVLYLTSVDTTTDLYTTAYQPACFPSAMADQTKTINKPAQMIDLYTR